jgi:hypothetical protein
VEQHPDAACPALNRTSMNLMDEELVMMRLGSQELQQKRKILKITMQNRCMIDLRLVRPLFFGGVLRP